MAGENFDILILDAAIKDQPFAPLVQKIIACVPDQKIAIVPPENKPDHPLLEDVPAHGFLFRPFQDADLLNLVQRLAASAENGQIELSKNLSPGFSEDQKKTFWPEDPKIAGVELSRLLLGSSALAGLITRDGALFIQSGRISENGAHEVVQMLSQVKNDREKDLVRFTFLVADNCEALVYGVSLISGWMLVLIYDVSMPLTRVRSQAMSMAARLREQMPLDGLLESSGGGEPNPEDTTNDEDTGDDDSGEVDISAILKEINSKDAGSDEFLNLNSLDNELFSLINEVNAPEGTAEAEKEDLAGGEKPEVVEKIYTRPLKLPESMKTDADLINQSADDAIQSADTDAGEMSPIPSGEKPNPLEAQTPRAEETEEDRISTEDAQAMAAALSQLEEQMGVVVGEDIPLIETPPDEQSSSPEESGLEDAGVPTIDVIQELAEGQVAPVTVSSDKVPAFEEEAPAEVIEQETEALVVTSPGGFESETMVPPDSPENEPVLEEVQDVPASLDEEEIPVEAVSDTRPTPVENPAINTVDEQVEETVLQIGEISSPPATAPEESIESVIEMKGHPFTGEQLYTVVFAPKRIGQFLTGELVDNLANLLKTSITGFPWKLAGMAIRPEYLRLSVEISHHLDPVSIIDFIKEYTDHVIRQQYSQMGKENSEAPFWANEYLSLPGYSIPEGDHLREFLQSIKSESENPGESV